jgi:hypothetical protein
MQRSAFRSTYFQPQGVVGAVIVEAKIIDLNIARWTVDVVTSFDQKFYLNVQVSSNYMNPTRGEGIYIFPEIGSKCHVCIPSDGPPPFVLDFIMPQETLPDTSTEEAPTGTNSLGGATQSPETDATFAGGRRRPKPGDIVIRGRDGNFAILHRGGVLQLGASSLAQRIYIPLQNIIKDISQNYHHHNVGGSINWAVATGPSEDNPPTSWKQTLRLHANEEKATIRIARGTWRDFVPEHKDGTDNQSEISELALGEDDPIIYEVTIAPEEISADDGCITPDTGKKTKLRYFFDKGGGAYLGAVGNVLLATKGKLRVKALDDIEVTTEKSLRMSAQSLARIDGGGVLELAGDVVKIGPAAADVAHVGSIVEVSFPIGQPITGPMAPGSPGLALPVKATGTVTRGRANVKV